MPEKAEVLKYVKKVWKYMMDIRTTNVERDVVMEASFITEQAEFDDRMHIASATTLHHLLGKSTALLLGAVTVDEVFDDVYEKVMEMSDDRIADIKAWNR